MNTPMKKILALTLGILLTAINASGLIAAIPPAEPGNLPGNPLTATASPEAGFPLPADPPDNVMLSGNITKTAIGNYTLTNQDEAAPYTEIELIVMEDTLAADCETGKPVPPGDIKDGDFVYAYVNGSSAADLPPAAVLRVMLCNIPENKAVPAYLELRRPIYSADSTGVRWVTDKDLALGIGADAPLEAVDTAQMTLTEASAGQLLPGARVLAWYPAVTLSMPAQATAEKIVLLPYSYNGYVELAGDGSIYVNGSPLALDEKTAVYRNDGGFTMLPLRKIYEALGYTVAWDSVHSFIILEYGGEREFGFVFDMTHAGEMAELGGSVGSSKTGIDVINGVTFVSADDLARLSNVMFSRR